MSDEAHAFRVHQEEDVVAKGKVVATAVAAAFVGCAAVLFAGVLLATSTGTLKPSFAGPGGPKPAPRALSRIEQTPVLHTRRGIDVREDQKRKLQAWGWVDRRAGVAEIPIDRAMDIVVSEHAR